MATVQVEATFAVPPDELWAKVRDVGALSGLLDVIDESTIDGNKRDLQLADGRHVTEIILGIDDQLRRVAFTITDSPFPIEAHAASMQVLDADDGKSLFRWICDVTPDEMTDRLGQMMAGEIEQMKATFGT